MSRSTTRIEPVVPTTIYEVIKIAARIEGITMSQLITNVLIRSFPWPGPRRVRSTGWVAEMGAGILRWWKRDPFEGECRHTVSVLVKVYPILPFKSGWDPYLCTDCITIIYPIVEEAKGNFLRKIRDMKGITS
jgi:hypothetical protein